VLCTPSDYGSQRVGLQRSHSRHAYELLLDVFVFRGLREPCGRFSRQIRMVGRLFHSNHPSAHQCRCRQSRQAQKLDCKDSDVTHDAAKGLKVWLPPSLYLIEQRHACFLMSLIMAYVLGVISRDQQPAATQRHQETSRGNNSHFGLLLLRRSQRRPYLVLELPVDVQIILLRLMKSLSTAPNCSTPLPFPTSPPTS
jgi:hypothetical protein